MKAIIIASGKAVNKDIFNELYFDNDFIICADGGLNYLDNLNIIPNLIVGDFDSVDESLLVKYQNIKTIRFSKDKDYTDTELAIEEAIKSGYREIIIFGATGTRLDHTMANMMLIEKYLKENVEIKIIDNNNIVQILDKNIIINKKTGYYLSIVPITECIEGITLNGLKYPLDNVNVQRGSTLCISNEIVDDKAIIQLSKGIGLLFLSRD